MIFIDEFQMFTEKGHKNTSIYRFMLYKENDKSIAIQKANLFVTDPVSRAFIFIFWGRVGRKGRT